MGLFTPPFGKWSDVWLNDVVHFYHCDIKKDWINKLGMSNHPVYLLRFCIMKGLKLVSFMIFMCASLFLLYGFYVLMRCDKGHGSVLLYV